MEMLLLSQAAHNPPCTMEIPSPCGPITYLRADFPPNNEFLCRRRSGTDALRPTLTPIGEVAPEYELCFPEHDKSVGLLRVTKGKCVATGSCLRITLRLTIRLRIKAVDIECMTGMIFLLDLLVW